MSMWRTLAGAAAVAAVALLAPPDRRNAWGAGHGRQPAGQRRSAPDLRRADAALQPEYLRQPLSLPGQPAKLVPWFADSHTVSADGLTWEFGLRPGVKFHDGSEIWPTTSLTASSVCWRSARRLGAFKPVLKPDNVTAPDKSTVRFVLDKPYAPFLAAIPIVMVVNPRVVKATRRTATGVRLASIERGGLGRLPARCHDLPPARARRPQEIRRPLPRLGRQPEGAGHDPGAADARDLHPRAGAAAGFGRHDRQLPADRPGRAHPEIQGRAHREEHLHARLHPAHEQQEAALRQRQRAEVLRRRLQLRRLHQARSSRATPSATRRPCPTTCGATPRTWWATTTI